MTISRRGFLRSMAAVAAVTASGLALPSARAVEALVEPEPARRVFPVAKLVDPDASFWRDLVNTNLVPKGMDIPWYVVLHHEIALITRGPDNELRVVRNIGGTPSVGAYD